MTRRSHHNRLTFAALKEARIESRDDRLMLASSILDKRVESFVDLTDDEMRDLATALSDWRKVEAARASTGGLTVDAIQHLLNLQVPDALRVALSDLCESMGVRFNENNQEQHENESEQ